MSDIEARIRAALDDVHIESGRKDEHEAVVQRVLQAARQAPASGEVEPAGIFGLSAFEVKAVAMELHRAANEMSDNDNDYALDLVICESVTEDDGSILGGPMLCVRDSEYPEEGVYPVPASQQTKDRYTHPPAKVPEGYVVMPKELTAKNGAKYAMSGEFYEVVELECTACDEDDEDCEVCSGNGSYTYRVPVSWTSIKAIYQFAVEKLTTPTPATTPEQNSDSVRGVPRCQQCGNIEPFHSTGCVQPYGEFTATPPQEQ